MVLLANSVYKYKQAILFSLYTQFTWPFLFLRKWAWLVRLAVHLDFTWQSREARLSYTAGAVHVSQTNGQLETNK